MLVMIVSLPLLFFFKVLSRVLHYISVLKKIAYFGWCPTVTISYDLEIKYRKHITLGKNIKIGPGSTLGAFAQITIGDDVTISKQVLIETAGLDHHNPAIRKHIGKPIIIGDNAWIGAGSIILSGITIGKGVVVAAGSVVVHDLPAYTVCAGVPAKVVKELR